MRSNVVAQNQTFFSVVMETSGRDVFVAAKAAERARKTPWANTRVRGDTPARAHLLLIRTLRPSGPTVNRAGNTLPSGAIRPACLAVPHSLCSQSDERYAPQPGDFCGDSGTERRPDRTLHPEDVLPLPAVRHVERQAPDPVPLVRAGPSVTSPDHFAMLQTLAGRVVVAHRRSPGSGSVSGKPTTRE